MSEIKLIIAGSRTVSPDWMFIDEVLADWNIWEHGVIVEVVSGAARGADESGERWASHSNVPVKHFPANWNTHGKAAGKLRNRQMADYADAALVFWDGMSSGAADMVTRMVARGKMVRVVPMKAGKP